MLQHAASADPVKSAVSILLSRLCKTRTCTLLLVPDIMIESMSCYLPHALRLYACLLVQYKDSFFWCECTNDTHRHSILGVCYAGLAASVGLAETVYGVSANVILDSACRAITSWDIVTSCIKSWVFGTIIAVVCRPFFVPVACNRSCHCNVKCCIELFICKMLFPCVCFHAACTKLCRHSQLVVVYRTGSRNTPYV